MESFNIFQMPSSSSSSSSPSPPFPFVGIIVLILIYVVILYLVIDFNEDFRLYSNLSASSTDGISGLSLEMIRELPWFECQRTSAAAICAVCLDGVRKGERCRIFPGCKHLFHAHCIDRWLVRRLNCPTCRSPFKMEPHLDVV